MTFATTLAAKTSLINELGEGNAYLVMAIALFIEEPDVSRLASEGLTEGTNDKKIDFIYHDKEARRLLFAQGTFSNTQKDSAKANKASDLNTAVAWMVSGDISTVPEKLRQIIQEFREALQSGDIDYIDLLYVHNLPESVGVARELQTVEEHFRKTLDNEKILIKSHELGKHKVEDLFSTQESHIEVADEIEFPSTLGIIENGDTWTSGIGTITGAWVHELFLKYGDKLYSANYRGFMGADRRKKVNSGIRDTAEKQPSDFWAFNNGITILTQKLNAKPNGKIFLKGISVINGAQTTGSIGSVDTTRADLQKVKLVCRVIECSDQETVDKIIRFNNTQNVITTWDQFSNDQDQKRIGDEFNDLGFAYNRKRGFAGIGDQIGIEQVLQPLLAFHGRPTDAVRGKNQLFVQKQLYRNAFENKKARHILFVYSLAKAIDTKRLELKGLLTSGNLITVDEIQLNLLRNLNFKPFLISVIANSLETIVGKPCDPLTVGFQTSAAKSEGINELAARWLPVVETFLSLLTAIVEPDTFFKLLSNDDKFLEKTKLQMDAMLSATMAQKSHQTFAGLVAAS